MRLYSSLRWKLQQIYKLLRIFEMRLGGCHVASSVKVFGRFKWLGQGENLTIGEGSSINEGVFLNARDRLTIGNNVHLSPYVQIHTGLLDMAPGVRHHVSAPIVIEDSVWIASGAVITAGVTVGANSVVGANAVVTRDVPKNTLVGGIPAKFIRSI